MSQLRNQKYKNKQLKNSTLKLEKNILKGSIQIGVLKHFVP